MVLAYAYGRSAVLLWSTARTWVGHRTPGVENGICSRRTTTMFSAETRGKFSQNLHDNRNARRVSQSDRDELIRWLTDPDIRPSSQKELSRRNYIRKTFKWDERRQMLLAVAKKGGEREREVITEDAIMDVVELVHTKNSHVGWDATWREVSASYYGILRADVIFLLKLCWICAGDPRKRPKGSMYTILGPQVAENMVMDFLDIGDIVYNDSTTAVLRNESHTTRM